VNCAQCAGPIISLDTYDSVTVTVDYKLCAFQVLMSICPTVCRYKALFSQKNKIYIIGGY